MMLTTDLFYLGKQSGWNSICLKQEFPLFYCTDSKISPKLQFMSKRSHFSVKYSSTTRNSLERFFFFLKHTYIIFIGVPNRAADLGYSNPAHSKRGRTGP